MCDGELRHKWQEHSMFSEEGPRGLEEVAPKSFTALSIMGAAGSWVGEDGDHEPGPRAEALYDPA